MASNKKPIVVVTGSQGNLGQVLIRALNKDYTVIGCDRPESGCDIGADISSKESIEKALQEIKDKYGDKIAAFIHLAAYFDFTGEESPLYESVNVKGTEYLLEALQDFKVERFIYSGTMLVHKPCERGDLIDEESPIEPKWAYPKSKAKAEEAIAKKHGKIPYTILRFAGAYDDESAVPTLAAQIARIYEKDIKGYFFPGDIKAGQAFIHKEDVVDVIKRTVERRDKLPKKGAILAGEPDVMSYDELQDTIGRLIYGKEEWETFTIPGSVAKAGAWLEGKAEPVIPDDYDQGKKPFIKPFMVEMASDHYALDISKAGELLDWRPKHRIQDSLPKIIAALKKEPYKWYKKSKLNMPAWMESAEEKHKNPEKLRSDYDKYYNKAHSQNMWAHFLNVALGFWLITSPFTFGYETMALIWSDVIAGMLVVLFGIISFSQGKWLRLARFCNAAVGMWLMFAPLLFWAATPAEYLNDTAVGTLVFAFALLVRPFPAMSPTGAMSGPEIPPGWDFSPSSWFQRLPIILLAFIGFYISRYLTAYQLGHIDSVWEPFFAGYIPDDGKNGTEEIITSSVSEAWPVPDAGLGALTYLLEILTGIIGSSKRWRTMPWLVLLFGFMIVPLGAISITFIIIQPILLGTWCSLCLIAAAAMLLQIPYSFDEIVATIGFLKRRADKGRPWMKVLFTGDTDDGTKKDKTEDDFTQPVSKIIHLIISGGISIPWNLVVCMVIALWLMFTRLTFGAGIGMANADHLIGSLVLTVTVTAFAEVARPIRFLNIFLGAALLITPFIYSVGVLHLISSILCGLGLIAFSCRRGPVKNNWGQWNKVIV